MKRENDERPAEVTADHPSGHTFPPTVNPAAARRRLARFERYMRAQADLTPERGAAR